MLPFFSYPKQHQPSLPVFKTILAPTLLLFLLLPKGTVFLENIFCCFSGLLPFYPPSEEQTVTSGLHLYWVRFQSPPPLLKSSSIPPTGFQRPWLACPSLAGFVPTLPPHPWGFSAPAEGLTSIFNPFFFFLLPRVLEPLLLNSLKNHSILELEGIWVIILMHSLIF